MKEEMVFIFLNYIFINYLEYIIHKFSHNKKYGGFLYDSHYIHHYIDHPPERLMVKNEHELNNTQGPYVVIMLSTYVLVYQILSFYYFKIFLCMSSLYLYTINELHNQYHILDSPLDKYEWFRKRKKLHHLHHIRRNRNFNLVFFTSDKMNNTFISSQ